MADALRGAAAPVSAAVRAARPTPHHHQAAPLSTAHDHMVCELLPLLRAADLLANCLRVLEQFRAVAETRPEFDRALGDACAAWCDPFMGADDETPEAVLSGLLQVATKAGRQVAALGAKGGAA